MTSADLKDFLVQIYVIAFKFKSVNVFEKLEKIKVKMKILMYNYSDFS